MNKLISMTGAAVVAALLSPLPAAAQGTWNLGGSSCNPNSNTPATAVCSSNGITATMSAWSNTGTNGALLQTALSPYDPNGFGTTSGSAENGSNGQHGFDNVTGTNQGGSVELMLIGFNSQVNLSSISIGWFSGDADVSVYRYNGTAPIETTAVTGVGTAGASLGSAWSFVSSVDLDGAGNTKALPNAAYSSWWIVSTYFGATTGSGTSQLTPGDDKYKLLAFNANTCAGVVNSANGSCGPLPPNRVAEPGSLGMAGLALVAAFTTRRKRAAAAA